MHPTHRGRPVNRNTSVERHQCCWAVFQGPPSPRRFLRGGTPCAQSPGLPLSRLTTFSFAAPLPLPLPPPPPPPGIIISFSCSSPKESVVTTIPDVAGDSASPALFGLPFCSFSRRMSLLRVAWRPGGIFCRGCSRLSPLLVPSSASGLSAAPCQWPST